METESESLSSVQQEASPVSSFEEEDTGTELERIITFARSDVFVQRLYHVCCMAEAAQKNGYAASAPVLVPLCSELSVDDEPEIRQALAEQLPQLTRVFTADGVDSSFGDIGTLIEINKTLLIDDCEEVQMTSEQSFTEISQIVKSYGRNMQQDMVQLVLKLSTDAEETHRVCAANLLCGLSESVEETPYEESVVPRIVSLSTDSGFRVRKAIALGLPRCFKALSEHLPMLERNLLPVFLSLSRDTVWAVRMACAEGLVRIAEVVSPESRINHLASTIELLARDVSTWVKDSALQMLGPFLALLHGSQELSECLVSLFTNMSDTFPGDNRLQLYCAYNFPAVVQSLGPHRWPELETAYSSLLTSNDIAVRRSLGFSLHELCAVVGQEMSQTHLINAYNSFMADVDEVRLGVAMNMVPLLTSLPAQSRIECVKLLENVSVSDAFSFVPYSQQRGSIAKLSSSESAMAALRNDYSEGADKKSTPIVDEMSGLEIVPAKSDLVLESTRISAAAVEEEERPVKGQESLVGTAMVPESVPEVEGRYVRVISAKRLWHLRKTVAEQLADMAGLLEASDVQAVLLPFALHLCRDPVAAVREEASKQAGTLVSHLLQTQELTGVAESLAEVKNFADSKRFRDRQIYAVISTELVKSVPIVTFSQEFLPALLKISQDPVTNVRIKAAEALIEAHQTSEELRSNKEVKQALSRLIEDRERDVSSLVTLELGASQAAAVESEPQEASESKEEAPDGSHGDDGESASIRSPL